MPRNSEQKERKDYYWWSGFGVAVVVGALVLLAIDKQWIHRDISIAYALFASLWVVVTCVILAVLASYIGGRVVESVPPLRWLADRIESRSTRAIIVLTILVGTGVIVAVLWLLKDTPIEPYDDF